MFSGKTKNQGSIYPDFISRNKEIPKVIADAKYKPLKNIGKQDYLQLLAYMLRFDAKTGYYLHPETEENEILKLWLNRGITYENNVEPRNNISITKHGLKIPQDVPNYAEFVKQMKINEEKFKTELITDIS